MRRVFLSIALLGLGGCPPPAEDAIRFGVDSSFDEVGLGPWLEVAFERSSQAPVVVERRSATALLEGVRAGRLDEVLLLSGEVVEVLEREGLLAEEAALGHEELLLIGPRENHLGKYASSRGAALLGNVARTNYRYLVPDPESVEGARHQRLFSETGDRFAPGSWLSTDLSGVELVRAAVERNAFALVRRSSVLLAAREGIYPYRIYAEGDPALVLEVFAGRVHPGKAGREREALHRWLTSDEGREVFETFGEDRLGHAIYAPGSPPEGEGASASPLRAVLNEGASSGGALPRAPRPGNGQAPRAQ